MDHVSQLLEGARDPHVVLLLSLLLAWFAGVLIHHIGRSVLLRLSVHLSILHHVLGYIDRCAGYAIPLLLVQMVLRAAPDDLRGVMPLQHLSAVLFILAMTWLLINAARGVGDAIELRHPINVVDNLAARTIRTQTRVLVRTAMVVILVVGLAAVLMSFPSVRTVGASLLASAGVIGLAIGMAAKPVLGNLIAGVQIALTQPIRIDDVLIVEGEWGRVEEITGSYVVLRIWDRRRMVIPLQWFIEHPFQNWTRKSADLIGSVFWWVDYGLPLEPVRAEIRRLCEQVPQWWDGEVAVLQVVDSSERSMQLRALMTARNSGDAWDLRCHIRAGVIEFIQREYPQYLPRLRTDLEAPQAARAA